MRCPNLDRSRLRRRRRPLPRLGSWSTRDICNKMAVKMAVSKSGWICLLALVYSVIYAVLAYALAAAVVEPSVTIGTHAFTVGSTFVPGPASFHENHGTV